jgi:amino acid adenylation domain-containing protein
MSAINEPIRVTSRASGTAQREPGAEELVRLSDGGPLGPGARELAHERFFNQASTGPGRIAVVSAEGSITYSELASRTRALARELRALGVGPESVVAVCLPRRPDAVMATLAVLEAGGSYLPIDPGYPHERQRFMLEDAGASVILTPHGASGELSVERLSIDPRALDGRGGNGAHPVDPGSADVSTLAYVMYTSGSTGRPKGVMVEHRSLAALVDWALRSFAADELSSVLASTSFGFDISLFELFAPLASGGRIVLAESLFELGAVGSELEVTLVNTVPSLMASFLAEQSLAETIRTVVLAGEPLSAQLVERVHAQPGVKRVVNAYGPTEDTVYSTTADVSPGPRPTIGRPIPGTRAYVVDPEGSLVTRDEAGELCLAGAGVARGYRGRPDLTNERFVADPFGTPGDRGRMYRTGDLVRWEQDGSLRHLGRIDDQLKIRGVRVEPGEIENALLSHSSVRSAAVLPRTRGTGDVQLVAYAVCEADAAVDGRALREFLRKSLPEPMVPATVVLLDEMPLTPNGKLDRKRLPDPPLRASRDWTLSETERRLAELWSELLELDRPPGPEDDFFELGGESLLAFRLLDRIAERFDRELPPDTLLEASTLRALAARVDASDRESGDVVVVNGEGTRVPCVYLHAGAGGMFTLRSLSAAVGPDQPLYGIQAYFGRRRSRGRLRSIEDTATECLRLLREVQPRGPYILTGHSAGGHVAFEVARMLESAGEDVAFVGLVDPRAPHTLRWPGRLVTRARELAGRGPEGRRAQFGRAVLDAIRTSAKVRLRLSTGAAHSADEPAFGSDDEPWVHALRATEAAYRPLRLHSDAIVFHTEESTRATGSRTLGWDRYVSGSLEEVRVPGGHLSMLLDPHVHALGRELSSRLESAPSRAR